MERVKAGVIGVGHFGRLHVKNLSELPCCAIAGVSDADPDRGIKIAEEFKVPFFPDQEKLMAASEALFVATATVSHAAVAARALALHKHVFVEKPAAVTAAEAAPLLELARRAGVKLQVGHIERFNPAFLALLESREPPVFFGAVRAFPYNPRGTDVSVVHDLMIHDIDMALRLIPSEIASVTAEGRAVRSATPDACSAVLRFKNGSRAELSSDRAANRRERTLTVRTASGELRADLDAQSRNILKDELESFLQSVLNDTPVRVPPAECVEALELADRILSLCA